MHQRACSAPVQHLSGIKVGLNAHTNDGRVTMATTTTTKHLCDDCIINIFDYIEFLIYSLCPVTISTVAVGDRKGKKKNYIIGTSLAFTDI